MSNPFLVSDPATRVVKGPLSGIAFGILLTALGILSSGSPIESFLDFPAFFFAFSVAISLTLFKHSSVEIACVYAGGVRGEPSSIRIIRDVGKNFLTAGSSGAVLGILQTAWFLDFPNEVGPGLQFAILSLFYGLMGYLFLGVCFEAAEKTPSDKLLSDASLATGFVASIIHFVHFLHNLDKPSLFYIHLASIVLPTLCGAVAFALFRCTQSKR
jgi:hypothetical protein